MLTHSLLRSFSAAITVAGVWIAIPNFGRAQDILKELEENEHGQNHAGHGKEHVTTPDKKKKAGAQEHAGHGGHKQHKKEHSGHKQAKDHGNS
jgi:hypothetical protein